MSDATDLPKEELAVDAPENAPDANATEAEPDPTVAHRDFSEWQGKDLVDRHGERIGSSRTSTSMSEPINPSSPRSRKACSDVI
jgi:hypothetical protein